MPPAHCPFATHAHRETHAVQNDGECFVSVRLQPHFAQILTHVRRAESGGRGNQTKPKAVAIRWFIGQLASPTAPQPTECPFPRRAHKTKAKSKTKSNSSCSCIDWQATGRRRGARNQSTAGRTVAPHPHPLPTLYLPPRPFQSGVSISGVGFRNWNEHFIDTPRLILKLLVFLFPGAL